MSELDITPIGGRCGPYMFVMGDRLRADGYRILLYGAYNANGLIGSEFNGIAVLDNNRMQVWADNIGGAYGRGWTRTDPDPVPADLRYLFEKMTWLPTEAFIDFVNKQERCRYHVEA